jgi:hypothetical protein
VIRGANTLRHARQQLLARKRLGQRWQPGALQKSVAALAWPGDALVGSIFYHLSDALC